ncbi:ATP-binding protein [Bacillus haimaensis]|uniref:ATP-binding protein n=1 Tax=Bacillus haimaensis TaxID=3160967 RepID=UPI003AA9AE39
MMEINMNIRDVLLNFFLIFTPIFFYQYIVTNYTATKSRLFLGVICGIAAVLCMHYPILSGDGFLWDLRWIALMIAVLYGGALAGSITATMLVVYRFSLGGLLGSVNVLLLAVVLFVIFILLRSKYMQKSHKSKLLFGVMLAFFTWIIAISAIIAHFVITDNIDYILQYSLPIFLVMGTCYITSSFIYIYFSEEIRNYTRMKENSFQAEKLNLVTELSELLSLEMKRSLDTTSELLENAQNGSDYHRRASIPKALKEIKKAKKAIRGYVNYSGQFSGSQPKAPLYQLAQEIKDLLTPYSIQKKISIEQLIPESFHVEVDAFRMKQLLLNLVKNAADATPKSGTIKMEAVKRGGQVYIIITDTGIGMSKTQLSNLIDFGASTGNTGVGRGLMVTFHLIQEMGGTLSFHSTVGKGTTVTIKLGA